MFEYHGWAVLRESTRGDDDSNLNQLVAELQQFSPRLNDASVWMDVRWINGNSFLTLAGAPNHRCEAVFECFRWVANKAPGSYGLMHVWDDECREFGNVFKVYILRRGKIEEQIDRFLSPCIPQIEDPFEIPESRGSDDSNRI